MNQLIRLRGIHDWVTAAEPATDDDDEAFQSINQSINQSRFFSVAQIETITETMKAWTVKLQYNVGKRFTK